MLLDFLLIEQKNIFASEQLIAYHLGTISRAFNNNELNGSFVENMDETHLLMDVQYEATLRKRGQKNPIDVVARSEGMTLVIHIIGGENARPAPPFFIFKNAKKSYPLKGVRNVPALYIGVGRKAVWVECASTSSFA